jgi:thiamine-monophosphate kinase
VSQPDEFTLISAWTQGRQSGEFLSARGVRIGIGDDAAVVGAPGEETDWLLAVDTMVEGVHFRFDTMGDADVGYKAMAACISDIAAMGGRPRHALVSVSVPPHWTPERMMSLYDGLYACADRYGVAVVGGDTTSAPAQLVVSVTVTGLVRAGAALRRDAARPGQRVFLTGPVGLSAGGLHGLLQPEAPRPPALLVRAHRRPEPHVRAGLLLAERGFGRALNDVSDGLANEAWEIAEASGVRLALRQADLPLSGELSSYARRCGLQPLDWMLYGGEDYVLLGTIDAADEAAARRVFREAGLPFFVIGDVEKGPPGVWLETATGQRRAVPKRGYNHFAEEPGT